MPVMVKEEDDIRLLLEFFCCDCEKQLYPQNGRGARLACHSFLALS
jgi:hypothetical protein